MNWIALTNNAQLEKIKLDATGKSIAIFKHSTRCGISRMVLKNFEREFNLSEDQIDMYYLDLLNFRELSNEISKIFDLTHQSPQLLLIKNGETIYNASHSDIQADKLKDLVKSM